MDIVEIKNETYKNYINEHKTNVINAFDILYEAFPNEPAIVNNLTKIEHLIRTHDNDKLEDPLLTSFRKRLFPINYKERDSSIIEYHMAIQMHNLGNKHHLEYWKERNEDPLFEYLVEYVCDIGAGSLKFGYQPMDYYRNRVSDNIKPSKEYDVFIRMLLRQFK